MTTYKEYIEQNEVSFFTLEQGFGWLYIICDISTVSSFFNASEISYISRQDLCCFNDRTYTNRTFNFDSSQLFGWDDCPSHDHGVSLNNFITYNIEAIKISSRCL